MTHTFKFSNISKLWHSKTKDATHKHPASKQLNQTRKTEDWAMSPEDALRVTYSGHK